MIGHVLFAFFVGVDVVKKRLDFIALREATFFFTLQEPGCGYVIPTSFTQKFVENHFILFGHRTSILAAPGEDCFIGATLLHAAHDSAVADSEEIGDRFVKSITKVFDIVLWKIPVLCSRILSSIRPK
jgi:hypothetical protein